MMIVKGDSNPKMALSLSKGNKSLKLDKLSYNSNAMKSKLQTWRFDVDKFQDSLTAKRLSNKGYKKEFTFCLDI